MIELMKQLCALPGPSGCEDAVREFVLEKVKPFADEIKTDAIGNIMVFRKGKKALERPVVVCAHMDEVGVIIKQITDDGMLKFGFVGGVDSPVINDFLIGYIEGAKSVNPDIKVDVRYTNDYVDTSIAKEYGLSMINDNHCDLIWGVAGNAGNGAAEAAYETGKAYFLGVDSDQELTLSSDLAAITLTSGLKNIGNSLIWFFDEMDAGRTYFGQEVSLGLAEGGVGIVTDKNFATFANDDLKAAITAAEEAIKAGDVVVDSALAEGGPDLAVQLKNEVQP